MGDVEILHRLFTNAAEGGAFDVPKARIVPIEDRDAGSVVTPDVLAALDDLLKKTTPASTQPGWVVRRFAGDGGQTYACVVTSHPDLVDAAEDRAGVLNHARLVRVDEPSFDAAALVETALAFPLNEICGADKAQRLRTYVNAIASEAPAFVRGVSVTDLQALQREDLENVLLACLSQLEGRKHVAIATGTTDMAVLACAWAALPFASQRRSSWGIGVTESCPVDVIFSTSGKAAVTTAGEKLVEGVRQYVRLLHEAPDTFSALFTNPTITDASAFFAAVERSALAPQLASMPGRGFMPGKEQMPKKEKAAKPEARRERDTPRAEWQPLDADLRDELNRQQKAMDQLVREQVADGLAAFEARHRAQSSAGSSATNVVKRLEILTLIAIALAVLAIAGVAWLAWRTPVRSQSQPSRPAATHREPPPREDEATTPAVLEAAALTPAQEAVQRAEASGKWPEEWKALLETDPELASNAIVDLTNAYGLAADARKDMTGFAGRIARREDLGSAGRDKLRQLLVAVLRAGVEGRSLEAVKRRYGVTSTSTDPNQKSLQSEIVLRWMAETQR